MSSRSVISVFYARSATNGNARAEAVADERPRRFPFRRSGWRGGETSAARRRPAPSAADSSRRPGVPHPSRPPPAPSRKRAETSPRVGRPRRFRHRGPCNLPSSSHGAYRDRTGDLRLAKPVATESGEGGSNSETADLAADSDPPLPETTG